MEPEDSYHGGEAIHLNDFQRWVVGRLMKRLLNQVSPMSHQSNLEQAKALLSKVEKMLKYKTSFEKSNNIKVSSAPEIPEETTLRIMKCVKEFELRDKVFNQKRDTFDDFARMLSQQDKELSEQIDI